MFGFNKMFDFNRDGRRFLYNKQNQKNSSKENKEEKEAAVS